jgi:hypothetical protein
MKIITRKAALRLLLLFVVLAAVLVYSWATMIRMPGKSFTGELPPWTDEERALAETLREIVEVLAGDIGERSVWIPTNYHRAANYIEERFRAAGFEVDRQEYTVEGVASYNLEAELAGLKRREEILVIGAHYDTVPGSPGANDNASGVAATLALASLLADASLGRTVRFVAFANEEMPFFQTEQMGSFVYAQAARARGENIVGMISLETIGYFSQEKGSQQYPFPFNLIYPSRGNFIGFISHTAPESRALVREAIGAFRDTAPFPSEGAAIPEKIPGVGWSDHWAFWQFDYPAFMLTDTAPFRYPHYHTAEDTPDELDYLRMARIVKGMEAVIRTLALPAE